MNFSQDVFISYSPNDQEWVDCELLRRLDDAGIKYIEPRDFTPGSLVVNEIENAITRSRRTLLVITSDYIQSTWEGFANGMAFSFVLQTGQWRIIPAIREDCELPVRLRALVPIDLCVNSAESWRRLIDSLSEDHPGSEPARQQGTEREAPPRTVNQHPARDSLLYIVELMNDPEIRGAVSEYLADFKALRDQIRVFYGYKKVHDYFQQLEDQYSLIYHHGKSASIQQLDWEAIDIVEPKFQDISDDLIKCARQYSFATDRDLWVQKLNRAKDELRSAIDSRDAVRLKSATQRISGVLNKVPSRVNASMVTAAKALRLTSLEKALMTVLAAIADHSGGVTASQVDRIKRGVDELNEMDTNLRAILYLHDSLQEVDDELRRVEPELDEDVQQIVDAWTDLRPRVEMICGGDARDWAPKLYSVSADFDRVLAAEDQSKIKPRFRTLRSSVTRSFNEVDQGLLSLCGELEQEVGKPLAPLLAVLGQDDDK